MFVKIFENDSNIVTLWVKEDKINWVWALLQLPNYNDLFYGHVNGPIIQHKDKMNWSEIR